MRVVCGRLHLGAVAAVLGAGADVRSRDNNGRTAVHALAAAQCSAAAAQQAAEILNLLLKRSAQVGMLSCSRAAESCQKANQNPRQARRQCTRWRLRSAQQPRRWRLPIFSKLLLKRGAQVQFYSTWQPTKVEKLHCLMPYRPASSNFLRASFFLCLFCRHPWGNMHGAGLLHPARTSAFQLHAQSVVRLPEVRCCCPQLWAGCARRDVAAPCIQPLW